MRDMVPLAKASTGSTQRDSAVRTKPCPRCCVCGRKGRALYEGLEDRIAGVKGSWSLDRCPNRECGLIWINPTVHQTDTLMLYEGYHTHAMSARRLLKLPESLIYAFLADRLGYCDLYRGVFWKCVSRASSLVPTLRDMLELSVLGLRADERGTILDVGCGNGQFLAQMKSLGWQVHGVEPNPRAARFAHEQNDLSVVVGAADSTGFSDCSLDVVCMNHVLEHLPDPRASLAECYRVLKPGGKLIVMTPNTGSLGHKLFGPSWRGLEPPRHLCLFTARAIRMLLERSGFFVEILRTTARNARCHGWAGSRRTRDGTEGKGIRPSRCLLVQGYLFQIAEGLANRLWRTVGEELFVAARRPG